jgi:chlorobactene glucosyltransferase
MLKTSVSALLAEHADLVTAFPREEMGTWGERLLVPIIGWGMFLLLPVRLVQKFHISWLSVTIGQFMLFRREAYEGIGGFEAIKAEVADDMCLGRRIIASGHEWRLLNGTRQVSCRMYQGFWQAVNGFGKSLFGIFDYRILPYILIWWFMGVAFLDPVVALVSRWLGYPLTTLPPIYAVSFVALTLILLTVAHRHFHFPAFLVFLYPVSLALFITIALRSMFQSFSGTSTWKDRVLERAAIRWL